MYKYMSNTKLPKNDYKKLIKQLNLYGFKSYKEFLESNLWREFRTVVIKNRKGNRCESCGKKGANHLHHRSYKRILDPKLVNFLCKDCHIKAHRKEEKSIEDATQGVIGKKGRTESMRILDVSNLPETLHHSLHACGVINRVRNGEDPQECITEYKEAKLKKKDFLMIELAENNADKILDYLRTFTTR